MAVLIWGIFSFLLAFFLHLLVWRTRLPKRQARTMLIIFFGVFPAIFLGAIWLGIKNPTSSWFLHSFSEYIHTAFLHLVLTLAYLNTYPALEADSPSLVVTGTIFQAGRDGLAKDIFQESMTDDILLVPRLKDLLLDEMAFMEGEKYRLTSKGIWLARIFSFYRHLIRAPKGG